MRLLLVLLLLAPAPSLADRADDARMAAARERFNVGKTLYDLGNYRDALREFAAGYALVPKPQFLLNIGQCHRQLGEIAQARRVYERFLALTDDNDRDRPSVHAVLAELKRQEESAPLLQQPTFEEPKKAEPAPPPAAVVVAAPAPPPQKSFVRRHWWIFPVGAVVLTGVVVGIYFGATAGSGDPCSGATSGCLDVR
jgi:tetratricopeptide (TPR) repeat protein